MQALLGQHYISTGGWTEAKRLAMGIVACLGESKQQCNVGVDHGMHIPAKEATGCLKTHLLECKHSIIQWQQPSRLRQVLHYSVFCAGMNEEVGHVSYGRISRGWWDIVDEGPTHMDVPLSKEAVMAAVKEVSRQASHQHVGPCTPGYVSPKLLPGI
jgi:hypothetical protein